jgi:hypothetical protein
MSIIRRARAAALALAALFTPCVAIAAQPTTGTLSGTVVGDDGKPVVAAAVSGSAPSGRYAARSDTRGRFLILGVVPDSYVVCAEAAGREPACLPNVLVQAGETATLQVVARAQIRTIGRVRVSGSALGSLSTSDVFTVDGNAARALTPPASSTGLAQYLRGTVQGAIANVPGVELDPFANAVIRGTKSSDTIFDYDSVPIPQGLIAEPGGNVDGAQLFTTGVATTTVTLAGFTSESDNALGGVVNQIPAIGTSPARASLEFAQGLGSDSRSLDFEFLSASPDLRWRYALATASESKRLAYGDGTTFYPSEAATNGLALASRGTFSVESNVHYRASSRDDLALLGLFGSAEYDQYGSPFAGETVGAFDGTDAAGNPVAFPGESNPSAPVGYAAGVRGSYSVLKATWTHTGDALLSRFQLYRSRYGSSAGGPFWDENGFPNGSISLAASQGGVLTGFTYDGDAAVGAHRIRFGGEYRIGTSFLSQVIPTADEFIRSQPTIDSELFYASDAWKATQRLTLGATLRASAQHVKPSFGTAYDTGGLDPHFGIAYRVGDDIALRADFDHQTIAPLPLQADRVDTANVDTNGNPAPFVPLASESGNDFSYSIEGRGRTSFRLTYYQQFQKNVIDVLPFNFRSAVANGQDPSGLGVPTNAGLLRSNGLEFYAKNGGLTLSGDLVRASSSSASQFALNSLNAPAVAAGHLFPAGYVPDLTASLAYEFTTLRKHLTVRPSVSYESGYFYGNGRSVYVFDANGKPIQVPNDNYVNPGANYYFLRDPSMPYDATSNPYIGNLGTNEGNDPNTLRSPSQLLANLHLETTVVPHITLAFDITNLFGTATPTAYQSNPYLIGPPGYAGGNALYANCYAQIQRGAVPCAPGTAPAGVPPYRLGNGIPTNDGVTQAVPWSYGTAGYVAQSYPLARTFEVRASYRL